MIFRQLFDDASSTYSYLLADSGEAVLIDPVLSQARRDGALLDELGLRLTTTIETHVHADHITGAYRHKLLRASKIAVAESSGAKGFDVGLKDGDTITFGNRSLTARATPGHTSGCMSFVLDDKSAVFTGDALLIRGCGRTDFQGGSSVKLYQSIHNVIFSLPDACIVWPGHDYQGRTASSVGEEKTHNPRLGGNRSIDDFTGYMDHLGLPHPKKIDEAVPANLQVGKFDESDNLDLDNSWAPLRFTFAGIWEIDPHVLSEMLKEVDLIDVREPGEFTGEMGHIPGARSIPLDQLESAIATLERKRPAVLVCRSGGRSAQACVILARAGIRRAANLAGGMIHWRDQGLPTEGATSSP